MFYLLFVPAIDSIITKIIYVNTNSMQVLSNVERMDEIMASQR